MKVFSVTKAALGKKNICYYAGQSRMIHTESPRISQLSCFGSKDYYSYKLGFAVIRLDS